MTEDADSFLGIKPQPATGDLLSSATTEAKLTKQHEAARAAREEENRRRPKQARGPTCRLCGSKYNIFTAELGSRLCKACSEELAAIQEAKSKERFAPKPILQPANDSALGRGNQTITQAGTCLQSAAIAQVWMVVFSACSVISIPFSLVLVGVNIAKKHEWSENGAGGACSVTFLLLLATFIAWVCFVVKLYKAGSLLKAISQPPLS